MPLQVHLTSYLGVKHILEHEQEFNVTRSDGLEWLMAKSGRAFMLGRDTPFDPKQKESMSAAQHKYQWQQQLKESYEYITLKLLRKNSCKLAGMNQVDITRE